MKAFTTRQFAVKLIEVLGGRVVSRGKGGYDARTYLLIDGRYAVERWLTDKGFTITKTETPLRSDWMWWAERSIQYNGRRYVIEACVRIPRDRGISVLFTRK